MFDLEKMEDLYFDLMVEEYLESLIEDLYSDFENFDLVGLEIVDQEIVGLEIVDQEIVDKEIVDQDIVDQDIVDQEIVDQDIVDQEVADQVIENQGFEHQEIQIYLVNFEVDIALEMNFVMMGFDLVKKHLDYFDLKNCYYMDYH